MHPETSETEPIERFDIHIDRKPYIAPAGTVSGKQLRELAGLTDTVDLYREETGDIEDELIRDDQDVRLKPGQHFYSTPSNITPGRA